MEKKEETKKPSGSMKTRDLSPDPAAACTGGICPPKTDILQKALGIAQGLCYYANSNPRYQSSPAGTGRPDTMAKGSFSPSRAWLQGGRRTWAL